MRQCKQLYQVWSLLCLLVCGLVTTLLAEEHAMTLTRDGAPAAVIVIAKKPTHSAQFAAIELQDQIRTISGATLPISSEADTNQTALYVGETEIAKKQDLSNTQFAEQEYAVKFIPGGIVLTGRDAPLFTKIQYDPQKPETWSELPGIWEERGTLNAVYDFLERFCGVRYFNPTEFGTDFPAAPTLLIHGKDIRRAPFFRYRDIYPLIVQPELTDRNNIMLKSGTPQLNAWRLSAYPHLAMRLSDQNAHNLAYRNIAYRYLLRSRAGGAKMVVNHSLYSYFNHAKGFIRSHPEWFAQGYGDGEPSQMCYSNSGVINQVAQEAINYFEDKDIEGKAALVGGRTWGEDNFSVVPQDNDYHCKCPECRSLINDYDPGTGVMPCNYSSDLVFNFVNKIAEKVYAVNPQKTISTLAYAGYSAPPKFKLAPNISVQFCWTTNRGPDNEIKKSQELLLNQWAEKAPGRGLYVWLYYTFPLEQADGGNFNCFPGFFAHEIDRQFKLFYQHGIKGIFHCGYGQEVESYVTFRLMDDPTLDINQLLNEYFQRMFGPAAQPMQRFYNEIESAYMDLKNYPAGIGVFERSWTYQGTPERMKRLQTELATAKNLAATAPYRERVTLWEKGLWSYMTAGAEQYKAKVSAPMPDLHVPATVLADGDTSKVDWSKAIALNEWFNFGQNTPATRRLAGRMVHDGKYLYVELSDPCNTNLLEATSIVFPADDWEIFIAAQRGKPYRQYAVGPTGKIVGLSHAEVNFRNNVPLPKTTVLATSVKHPQTWLVRLALPLETVLPQVLKPGDTIYMNILRLSSQKVSPNPAILFDISSLVSNTSVHDPIRAARVTLMK